MACQTSLINQIFKHFVNFKTKYVYFAGVSIGVGFGIYMLRRYFAGGTCHCKTRLDGKTVGITGGNAGIGRQTATLLAHKGARVILACRNLLRSERVAESIRRETGNERVYVRVVDLASFASIRHFTQQILRTEKHIHVLINNAGICACPYWKTEDGMEMQLAVNHLGHFLMTNQLLPLLQDSTPSRIINVSSIAHESGHIDFADIHSETGYNPLKAYCQSKLANILFTNELHTRLQRSGVTAYAVHPGVVRTELGRYGSLIMPRWKLWMYNAIRRLLFKCAHQGAQTSVHCALAEGIEIHSGKYFRDCSVSSPAPQAEDVETAARLWELSETLCNIENTHTQPVHYHSYTG